MKQIRLLFFTLVFAVTMPMSYAKVNVETFSSNINSSSSLVAAALPNQVGGELIKVPEVTQPELRTELLPNTQNRVQYIEPDVLQVEQNVMVSNVLTALTNGINILSIIIGILCGSSILIALGFFAVTWYLGRQNNKILKDTINLLLKNKCTKTEEKESLNSNYKCNTEWREKEWKENENHRKKSGVDREYDGFKDELISVLTSIQSDEEKIYKLKRLLNEYSQSEYKSQIYNALGGLYLNENEEDVKEAFDCYGRAIEEDVKNIDAHYSRLLLIVKYRSMRHLKQIQDDALNGFYKTASEGDKELSDKFKKLLSEILVMVNKWGIMH